MCAHGLFLRELPWQFSASLIACYKHITPNVLKAGWVCSPIYFRLSKPVMPIRASPSRLLISRCTTFNNNLAGCVCIMIPLLISMTWSIKPLLFQPTPANTAEMPHSFGFMPTTYMPGAPNTATRIAKAPPSTATHENTLYAHANTPESSELLELHKLSESSFTHDLLMGSIGVFIVALVVLFLIPLLVYGVTFVETVAAL